MLTTTAFDVAGSILERARNQALSPLKLQKLVFYSFGWFGHLTADRLFEENFYAMEYGPVVSPLLSAHSGLSDVSKAELEGHQRRALKVSDPYVEEIVDAVWSSYGRHTHSELIEMTHCEAPWKSAWESKPTYARRNDLSGAAIVEYFAVKRSAKYRFAGRLVDVPILALLPDRRATRLSQDTLARMESDESRVPESHITSAAELRRRFMTA